MEMCRIHPVIVPSLQDAAGCLRAYRGSRHGYLGPPGDQPARPSGASRRFAGWAGPVAAVRLGGLAACAQAAAGGRFIRPPQPAWRSLAGELRRVLRGAGAGGAARRAAGIPRPAAKAKPTVTLDLTSYNAAISFPPGICKMPPLASW